MKRLLALLLALTLALPCFCAAAQEGEDVVLATAYDGAVSVMMSEVKDEFDEMLEAYIGYYAQYGYEMDKYDVEFQNSVAQETVQMKLSQRVAEEHAKANGYELTAEKDEQFKAEALAAIAEMLEYYKQYLVAYDIPEDEVEGIAKEEMAAAGYSYESLYESARLKDVLDHLYVLSTEGIEVTEDEVLQAFNAKVEEQKANYDADADSFISAYLNQEDILYTPENVRLMRCIFTALEETTATEEEAAAQEEPTEAEEEAAAQEEPTEAEEEAAAQEEPTEAEEEAAAQEEPTEAEEEAAAQEEPTEAEEEAAAQEEPTEAEEEAAAQEEPVEAEEEAAAQGSDDPLALSGLARANAVMAKLEAGEDFDAVMKAYNEDSSTEEQMMLGYPVAEGSTMYGDEFKNAAMALEKVGDVSGVITTDFGYFILKYADDLQSGTADFASRQAAETEELLTNRKNDAYSTYVNTMLDDANLIINDLSPMFNIYVGEASVATIAYASVTEDTALNDMPAGDAVAQLASGTTLDVLGKIDADGGTYAFVAVPGTMLKGYVKASVMADMAEADALAVDNTQLVTTCAVEVKKPTFTIVMNDGSVIYGELYPEKAPESVGNFVALANGSFYDGLIFHRVIPGFMIQGGDPNGTGTGGPGYSIKGEFANNGVENTLSHVRGVLSMARSTAMDSAGSQFFIMHADSDFLDGDYAAFGYVLGGMETVDLIASQPTNSSDKPMSDQTMRTVYVETYGQTYEFTRLED